MVDPFIGSEAIAAGTLTRHALRRDFVALHQDVYVAKGVDITPLIRATAAWLRSRRRGILAGLSAAALHGARWIEPNRPAAIIDTNRRRTSGVEAWADAIEDDEVWLIRGMAVTSPARTALDIASRYPEALAVASVDALARATDLKLAEWKYSPNDTRAAAESGPPAQRSNSLTPAPSHPRNLAEAAAHPRGFPASADADPGVRVRPADCVCRYGLGGHQSRGGVRRRPSSRRPQALQQRHQTTGDSDGIGLDRRARHGRGRTGRHHPAGSRRPSPPNVTPCRRIGRNPAAALR